MTIQWTPIMKKQIKRDLVQGVPFITVMSAGGDIRWEMEQQGYSESEHQLGLDLLFKLMAQGFPWESRRNRSYDMSKKALKDELNAYHRRIMTRGKTIITHRHPEQLDFLFRDLTSRLSYSGYMEVNVWLIRLNTLREGTDPRREALRESDRAAVATLEERGLAGEELERRMKRCFEDFLDTASSEGGVGRSGSGEAQYLEWAQRFHA